MAKINWSNWQYSQPIVFWSNWHVLIQYESLILFGSHQCSNCQVVIMDSGITNTLLIIWYVLLCEVCNQVILIYLFINGYRRKNDNIGERSLKKSYNSLNSDKILYRTKHGIHYFYSVDQYYNAIKNKVKHLFIFSLYCIGHHNILNIVSVRGWV